MMKTNERILKEIDLMSKSDAYVINANLMMYIID